MPSPLGYSHITSRGPRGWFARWHHKRRVRRVAAALAKRRVLVVVVAALVLSGPGASAERPVVPPRCSVVAVESVTLIETLLPVRAGRVVTAETTRCRTGHGPTFTTVMTVTKFADGPPSVLRGSST